MDFFFALESCGYIFKPWKVQFAAGENSWAHFWCLTRRFESVWSRLNEVYCKFCPEKTATLLFFPHYIWTSPFVCYAIICFEMQCVEMWCAHKTDLIWHVKPINTNMQWQQWHTSENTHHQCMSLTAWA